MSEHGIGERQRWAWLASGLSVVAAVQLCGMNWLWVLLGGTAISLYYLYIENKVREDGLAKKMEENLGLAGRVLSVFLAFWIVIVMGYCACYADAAFPMVDGFPGLGWVMLALAAWGSKKGSGACAACSGILCLFLVALYGIVAVFSAADVQAEYLVPTKQWQHGLATVGEFLLPSGVWCVGAGRRKGKSRCLVLILPILAAALSAVTWGVLSPELAQQQRVPLYELARSVSVLGVVERIEPLLSAAMTLGLFCLLSSQACACRELLQKIVPGKWAGSICCLLAAGVMLFARAIPGVLLLSGNVVMFLVLPLAITAFEKK